jgi:hypothetical protein
MTTINPEKRPVDSEIQPVDECKCKGPKTGELMFFCPYHQCRKTEGWHQLCRTHPKYRAAWNKGEGPGQQPQISNDDAKPKERIDQAQLESEALERLGIKDKAIRYCTALVQWAKAGFPQRSGLWVAAIYERHCAMCEHYEDEQCMKCGCFVRPDGLAIRNKIRMATEHCPIGLW